MLGYPLRSSIYWGRSTTNQPMNHMITIYNNHIIITYIYIYCEWDNDHSTTNISHVYRSTLNSNLQPSGSNERCPFWLKTARNQLVKGAHAEAELDLCRIQLIIYNRTTRYTYRVTILDSQVISRRSPTEPTRG